MDYYDVEKGYTIINNYNIKDINKEALRDKISYIFLKFFFLSWKHKFINVNDTIN